MGLGSFIAGSIFGAACTYWGSEKVHDNINESLAKSEQLLRNQDAINARCVELISQWYHEGSLNAVLNTMNQQRQMRSLGYNPQSATPQFNPPTR
jgi:uncharacterized protein YdiU (UPF0061 family)